MRCPVEFVQDTEARGIAALSRPGELCVAQHRGTPLVGAYTNHLIKEAALGRQKVLSRFCGDGVKSWLRFDRSELRISRPGLHNYQEAAPIRVAHRPGVESKTGR
jgi:hypothetical protein